MKLFLAIIFSVLALNVQAQDKVCGNYYNYFGSELKLKPDNTFEYRWKLEQSSSWSKGTWVSKNDTLYLKIVPVYDTLHLGPNKVRLILSVNELSETITSEVQALRPGVTEGQNQHPIPDKLFFQGTRLYFFENDGSLMKNKVRGYRTERKFDPWYIKMEEK